MERVFGVIRNMKGDLNHRLSDEFMKPGLSRAATGSSSTWLRVSSANP